MVRPSLHGRIHGVSGEGVPGTAKLNIPEAHRLNFLTALHRLEELIVGLGVFQLVQQELDGRSIVVHGVQQLTQNPHTLNIRFCHQQIFTARARATNIDGRIHTLLRNFAIKVDFHVTCALELFVDHFVHFGTRAHQSRRKNGQAATLFYITGRTKEALRLFQRVGIHTTGQHLARRWNHRVVSTSKTSNGIQQDNHIFLMLNQTLGLLDDHFSNLNVTRRRLIKGGGNHFAAHGALHFSDLFRTLINQQNDDVALRMIARNRLRNALHQQGFTSLRWRYNQTTLTLTDRCNQIQHTGRQVFRAAVACFKRHALIGKQRSQVFKQDFVAGVIRLVEVNLCDFQQGKIALAVFRRANLASNRITGTQVKPANLAGGNVNVVWPGQVGGVCGAEEAETILQNLQYAVAVYVFAAFGMFLQYGEDNILFTRTCQVIEAHLLRDVEQFGHGVLLEFSKIHRLLDFSGMELNGSWYDRGAPEQIIKFVVKTDAGQMEQPVRM